MPFKAKINGKTVIAPDISDYEWIDLKKLNRKKDKIISLLCCESKAYLRVSKLGTKHFVHKIKKNCNCEPESIDHLKAKEIIYKCCKKEGWNAEPEYNLKDCVADVFATDGKIEVVFEVQLSPQSEEDTILRHNKYEEKGIKCVWFFKKLPHSLSSNKNIPAFSISKENDAFFVMEMELNIALKKTFK